MHAWVVTSHPEVITVLKNYSASLAPPLRNCSAVSCLCNTPRAFAPANAELGGKAIPKGSRVVAVLAAGNRDPDRFSDPDRLDLLRHDNRHLAFGRAAHFCFGAPLARMKGQIAFTKLLTRRFRGQL